MARTWVKNYNTGGVVASESGANPKTVRVTLYHDSRCSRALTVPIAANSSVSTEPAKQGKPGAGSVRPSGK